MKKITLALSSIAIALSGCSNLPSMPNVGAMVNKLPAEVIADKAVVDAANEKIKANGATPFPLPTPLTSSAIKKLGCEQLTQLETTRQDNYKIRYDTVAEFLKNNAGHELQDVITAQNRVDVYVTNLDLANINKEKQSKSCS